MKGNADAAASVAQIILAVVIPVVGVAIGCGAAQTIVVVTIVVATIAVMLAVADGTIVGAHSCSQGKPIHNLEPKKHSSPQPALISSADRKESKQN